MAREKIPPYQLKPSGSHTLHSRDFGPDSEVLRDFARTFLAKGILCLRVDIDRLIVAAESPQVGNPSSHEECRDAIVKLLQSDGQLPLTESVVWNLLRMLSVSPAVALMVSLGCPPCLQNHRFVIVHGGSQLRCLTMGFLPDMSTGKPAWLMCIASPDLTVQPANNQRYNLTYTVRPVSPLATIEDELTRERPFWVRLYE